MERCHFGLALTLACGLFVGCSGSSPSSGTAADKVSAAGKAVADNGSTPAVAVREFLDAVRTGNDAKANAMLTEKAKIEVKEVSGGFTPRASDTAKFEVGEFEYATEEKDLAHVASKWTDLVEGKPETYEYLWGMRKDAGDWRVAGVVFKVFDDELPLVLNFEDGKDMVTKLRLTAEEMERRKNGGGPAAGKATEQVATKPADPVQK